MRARRNESKSEQRGMRESIRKLEKGNEKWGEGGNDWERERVSERK